MADSVAAYLITQGLGHRHLDMFVGNAPEHNLDFFLISDTTGLKPTQDYPVNYPAIQVAYYAQASHYQKAFDKINSAFILLNRKQNIDIGDYDCMFIQAVASPQCVGLDRDTKRWLFTFNVIFMVRGTDGQ